MPPFEMLSFGRKVGRVYGTMCTPILRQYDLNQTEFDLLMFLANNPDKNTARDACRIRGIKKGLVSVTADSLLRRGLITRTADADDRRLARLIPTDASAPIVSAGREVQAAFFRAVTSCLTKEELETYIALTQKLVAHVGAMDTGGSRIDQTA